MLVTTGFIRLTIVEGAVKVAAGSSWMVAVATAAMVSGFDALFSQDVSSPMRFDALAVPTFFSGDSDTRRLLVAFSAVTTLLSLALTLDLLFAFGSLFALAAADVDVAALSFFFSFNLLCTLFFIRPLAGNDTIGASGRLDLVREPMDLHVRRLVVFAIVSGL